ncbi:DUF3828 domain-containing protein [Rhizobium sp. 9140]|uniref:DUF3828 domain-containing protein n=1 Tax=Rhizobium sp. 9140 TaxID=1761900 RepID=UPI00079A9C10|nr:DUF3828 domain-containing protein [Rhizobium sp. 9140]CZT35323.1 Protein of unknown function (DUF3828) [Rhizobium sp. 9140]
MRLPLLLLSTLLMLFATAPSFAATYRTPEALIKALYRYDPDETDAEAPSPYTPFFSDALNARFQADRDSTPEGEVGAIDFDPVISGNDGHARKVTTSAPIIIDDRAELEVSFENGGPVTLYYTLVQEHGGWKVDDIANQQGDIPWSLSSLFDDASR